jgi:hypothetical protein
MMHEVLYKCSNTLNIQIIFHFSCAKGDVLKLHLKELSLTCERNIWFIDLEEWILRP